MSLHNTSWLFVLKLFILISPKSAIKSHLIDSLHNGVICQQKEVERKFRYAIVTVKLLIQGGENTNENPLHVEEIPNKPKKAKQFYYIINMKKR